MITVRRAEDRHHVRLRRQDVWLTFYPQDRADPLADGFGTIAMLNEGHLPPGAVVPRQAHRNVEVVMYVREGGIAHEDSMGRSRLIHAGEFQRMTAGGAIRYREANASRTEWAHVFQIWLRTPHAVLEPSHEQKRFCAAERRGMLRVVASPDGRGGSLRVHQDALIYSAILDSGQHMVHELLQGRIAWTHLVRGDATLGDIVLTTGDGVGVTSGRAVSLTAREETEILLFDVGAPAFERTEERRGA